MFFIPCVKVSGLLFCSLFLQQFSEGVWGHHWAICHSLAWDRVCLELQPRLSLLYFIYTFVATWQRSGGVMFDRCWDISGFTGFRNVQSNYMAWHYSFRPNKPLFKPSLRIRYLLSLRLLRPCTKFNTSISSFTKLGQESEVRNRVSHRKSLPP